MQLEILHRGPEGNPKDRPVLLVHGMWHGAWCWEDTLLPFFSSHGYDTYAVSLRGHGASGNEKSLILTRLSEYVADLEKAVDQLPAAPFLVGHSMGGMVVQKYLETQPTPGAALLAPVPVHGVWQSVLRAMWRHPLRFLRMNLTLSLMPMVDTPEIVREQFFADDLPEDFIVNWTAKLSDEAYLVILDLFLFDRVDPKLLTGKNIAVFAAGRDSFFSVAEQEKTARAYGTDAVIFPDSPHHIAVGKGWEAVANAMIDRFEEWS